jgi:hypothetical protein
MGSFVFRRGLHFSKKKTKKNPKAKEEPKDLGSLKEFMTKFAKFSFVFILI